jgi:hypothetical protein
MLRPIEINFKVIDKRQAQRVSIASKYVLVSI